MLGRAIGWSLGVHAAALVGLAWLLAMPPSSLATRIHVAVVTGDAVAKDDFAATDDDAATARDQERSARRDEPTAIEVRTAGDARIDHAQPGAPSQAPNPDVAAAAAARSSGHGDGAPTLVTDRVDAATLRAQPYDAVAGYRLQRIATSSERQSREQVRATPHPDRTPWLASRSGDGHGRQARRSRLVSSTETRADDADRARSRPAAEEAPGFARPDVQQNPAATEAAPPSDDVGDRVQAALVSDEKRPAPLELSRPTSPGAATSGHGDGALGYAPSARGTAPVPTGAPGLPDARALALASYQRTYDQYLAEVRKRVDPLWEFPRELAIRMEQGDVLVAFTIRKDGRVTDVRVLKGSGFAAFDNNVVRAIRKAAPFAPLPATLGSELRVTAPFEGSNPAIR